VSRKRRVLCVDVSSKLRQGRHSAKLHFNPLHAASIDGMHTILPKTYTLRVYSCSRHSKSCDWCAQHAL